ncbi:unnamed protein product [Rhizophagus irregularis]|nr:unnamed protein product [Rhizophagus irregularis]
MHHLKSIQRLKRENSEEEHSEFNDEFVKELKLLREVDSHPNINRFLGITKDSEYYILVLEYANEGHLKGTCTQKIYCKENDHDDLSISSNYSNRIDAVNSCNNDDNVKKFEGIFKSSDYDLDIDERKLKYKDYNIILCEKCNEKFYGYWYCRKCCINETEEEKYHFD